MHPHPHNSLETSTLQPPEDSLEAQQPAPCGLHGAACCASFVIGDYQITVEKSQKAIEQEKRALMVAKWGAEQERRNTAGLKIVPLEEYLRDQGLHQQQS
jgi:hypothetical protein